MGMTEEEAAGRGGPAEVIPAIYPSPPKVDDLVDRFWDVGGDLEAIEVKVAPPDRPLEVLERLGASPFERGRFPLIGFLATTYEKVSRYALDER